MKIKVIPKQNQQIKLPCLLTMIGSEGEDIILATSEDKEYYIGFALKHRRLEVGQHTEYIIKNLWKPYEGELVLSNE